MLSHTFFVCVRVFSIPFSVYCSHFSAFIHLRGEKNRKNLISRYFLKIHNMNNNCFVLFMTFMKFLVTSNKFCIIHCSLNPLLYNCKIYFTISCPVEWAFVKYFHSFCLYLSVCVCVSKSSCYSNTEKKTRTTLYSEVSTVSQTKPIRMEFHSPWHIYYML